MTVLEARQVLEERINAIEAELSIALTSRVEVWAPMSALMSEIAQNHYGSIWQSDLEYRLWFAVTTNDRRFGYGLIPAKQLQTLAQLALACNGWIVWPRDVKEEFLMPLHTWIPMYEAWLHAVPQEIT